MSDTNEPVETQDLNVDDLSDDQVDAEFEKMANEPDEPVEDPAVDEKVKAPEAKQEIADDKADDNDEPDSAVDNTKKVAPERVEANKNAALQEARKENRLLQKQLQELADKNDKLLKTFESAFQTKEPEPTIPSFEEDPIGHLKHKNDALAKQLSEINEYKNMSVQERQQHNDEQKFVENYRYQCNQFAAENPDFDPAYDFVMNNRLAEYKASGLSHDDAVVEVRKEERMIGQRALQDGVNPAERIYAIAKLRGYKEAGTLNAQVTPNANGRTDANLADANAKLDAIKRGQLASRTLNGGDTGASNKLTLTDLANLPDSEFEKLDWEKDVLIHG